MADKKTLYHSQLKSMGRVVVDVTTDVIQSKYYRQGITGKYFVGLRVNGEDRTYSSENDTCAARFNGPDGKSRKGQRVTIEATGGGKGQEATADILIHAAEWTPQGAAAPAQPAAAPAPAAPTPATPSPAPAAPSPAPPAAAAPQPAPAAPAPTSQRPPTMTANGRLFQIANLEMRVQSAMLAAAEKLNKERKINVSPETFHGMIGRAFIQMAREGFLDAMPYDHFVDIAPKAPPPPQPEAAPGQ